MLSEVYVVVMLTNKKTHRQFAVGQNIRTFRKRQLQHLAPSAARVLPLRESNSIHPASCPAAAQTTMDFANFIFKKETLETIQRQDTTIPANNIAFFFWIIVFVHK
jgi:hypothetical protein